MASKISQNLINNELETKSTKHAENVPNSIPLDLQETRFRMEWLSKITKTRGVDKYKQISKNCVEMKPKSMENRSRNSNKNYAWKQGSENRKKTQKWLRNGSKKWGDFGGNAYWGAFGGPNRFCDEKVGPQRCQSAPKARKISKKWHKRAPRVRKWAPKVNPFRSQAKMSS